MRKNIGLQKKVGNKWTYKRRACLGGQRRMEMAAIKWDTEHFMSVVTVS
jgi:hypothetical protein